MLGLPGGKKEGVGKTQHRSLIRLGQEALIKWLAVLPTQQRTTFSAGHLLREWFHLCDESAADMRSFLTHVLKDCDWLPFWDEAHTLLHGTITSQRAWGTICHSLWVGDCSVGQLWYQESQSSCTRRLECWKVWWSMVITDPNYLRIESHRPWAQGEQAA